MTDKFDPLCRIFGNAYTDIGGVQGPYAPRTSWPYPHFEVDSNGLVTPVNFDNNICIKMFEESLKTLTDQSGVKHPGVCPIAEGLARLYEMKAGVEKDVAHYDKAIEYFKYSNSVRVTEMGNVAESDPKYIEVEQKVAKIQRKKDRRLAKGAVPNETALANNPSSRVVEVLLMASGVLVFRLEDGALSNFRLPGVNLSMQASVLDEIDDDLNDSYSAAPFYLQNDEFLVGLITNEKQGQLNAIVFHTSSGRRSHVFKFSNEEPLGREYSYWASKDCHIIGLEEFRGEISMPLNIREGFR